MSRLTIVWMLKEKITVYFCSNISLSQLISRTINTHFSLSNSPHRLSPLVSTLWSTVAQRLANLMKMMPCTSFSASSPLKPKNQSTTWSVHKALFALKSKACYPTALPIFSLWQSTSSTLNPTWSKFSGLSYQDKGMPFAKPSETARLIRATFKVMDGKMPKRMLPSLTINSGCLKAEEKRTLHSTTTSMHWPGIPLTACPAWNTLTWTRTHMNQSLRKTSMQK